MNGGVGAITLIDCIASLPRAGASLASPGITKLEKANSAPALSPQPSAVTRVSTNRSAVDTGNRTQD